MLGRPLIDFDRDADYALYYRNVHATAHFFDHVAEAKALASTVTATAGDRSGPLSICLGLDWGLDLDQSEFEVEIDETQDSHLTRALESLPDEAFLDEHRSVLLGGTLARMLAEHELSPADVAAALNGKLLNISVTWRIVTDGTVWGAMLTATRSRAGIDGMRPGSAERALLPFASGVFTEPAPLSEAAAAERDRVLAPIRDPRLRAHVWTPYLDMGWARSLDGRVTGADPAVRYRALARRLHAIHTVAWDLAYFGEISLAIVQTGGQPPGGGVVDPIASGQG